MDWKSFIAGVISDVVWPIVAVIVIVLFRDPLKALIHNMRHFKGFGIDADFTEQAQSVAIEADKIAIQSSARGELTTDTDEVRALATTKVDVTLEGHGSVTPKSIQDENNRWGDRLRSLATSSPRSVVTEAWIRVESEIVRLSTPHGRRSNALAMLRGLITDEIIPAPVGALVQDLRALRNEVAHDSELDPGEDGAIAYLDACITAVSLLKLINA